MWLDSITQTLSNPDCGLSKPHIPDNTPYISHRLIRSNRQGPHPQIYRMTSLFFSHTVATICLLYIHRTFLFLLSFVSVTSTASSSSLSVALCFTPSPFLFLSLTALPSLLAPFTQPAQDRKVVHLFCLSVLYTKRKKYCQNNDFLKFPSNFIA